MIVDRSSTEIYRDRTKGMLILNHARRTCKGKCGRSKSVGQYAPNDTICMKCRLRA